ncbi:MAG: hypothetical protein IPI35_00815 [Deltaproteobacteria bacterium]|nr:hypothetical protein [Deltaproteobacteria bacterium]
MTSEELKATLEQLPIQDKEVRVEGRPGAWLGVVISPEYEKIPDADRQADVWNLVHKRFGLDGASEVEFIFTFSPTDLDEMEAQRIEEEAANAAIIAQAASGS